MDDHKSSDDEHDEIANSSSVHFHNHDSKSSPTTAAQTSEEDNMDYDESDDDDETSDHLSGRKRGEKGDVRRSHHNVLERKRRDLIKDSFSKLRDSVPVLASEKASRAQILKRAADFIQSTHQKNETIRADLEELMRKNSRLRASKAEQASSQQDSKVGLISAQPGTPSTPLQNNACETAIDADLSPETKAEVIIESEPPCDIDDAMELADANETQAVSNKTKRATSGPGNGKATLNGAGKKIRKSINSNDNTK